MSQDQDWKAVGDAAEAHGVPLRTAYNWVKSGRVESKTSGGITMVPASQFQVLAAQRGSAPASAPNRAGAGTGAGNPANAGKGGARPAGPALGPPLEGALAAQLFAAFEQGETPSSLVQRLQIAPQAALAAWRQWEELQTAAGTRPGLDARLTELEETQVAVSAQLTEFTNSGRLGGEVYLLRRQLGELRQLVQALQVTRPEHFYCSCGRRGTLAFHVRCGACGVDSLVGQRPVAS